MTTLPNFLTANLLESTIKDVRCAYDSKECQTTDWVDAVDPETMLEVKGVYKVAASIDGTVSLFQTFCMILRYSKANNIKF